MSTKKRTINIYPNMKYPTSKEPFKDVQQYDPHLPSMVTNHSLMAGETSNTHTYTKRN